MDLTLLMDEVSRIMVREISHIRTAVTKNWQEKASFSCFFIWSQESYPVFFHFCKLADRDCK